jgi:hypothetical protein
MVPNSSSSLDVTNWKICRDEQYGFSLLYPPNWHSTTPEGRCVQFQKGQTELPEAIPEVDVFIHVTALEGNFPSDYLRDRTLSAQGNQDVGRRIKYENRQELHVNDLPAVRAKFQSFGPTPNWGVEYAIRKGAQVLRIYISQPHLTVEGEFEKMIKTLQW